MVAGRAEGLGARWGCPRARQEVPETHRGGSGEAAGEVIPATSSVRLRLALRQSRISSAFTTTPSSSL
jgi:hypothetical protein